MAKIIRLNESDLLKLVKRVINEQNSSFPLKIGNKLELINRKDGRSYIAKIINKTATNLTLSSGGVNTYFVIAGPKELIYYNKFGDPYFYEITKETPANVLQPKPKPKPSPTPLPNNIKNEIIPKELVNTPLNLFVCPDYEPTTDRPTIPKIKITKIESVLPAGINDDLDEYIEPYVKITTDRNFFSNNKPLILYFVCSREGFITNHQGTEIDNFNVLVSQFAAEQGKSVENCKKEREKIDLDLARTNVRQVSQVNPKLPTSAIPTQGGLNEQSSEQKLPTMLFNRALADILKNYYCQEALASKKSRGSQAV